MEKFVPLGIYFHHFLFYNSVSFKTVQLISDFNDFIFFDYSVCVVFFSLLIHLLYILSKFYTLRFN